MATLSEMAANVRKSWLRNPLPQSPTVEQLYQALITETQHFYNRLTNSGKQWATGKTMISVPPLTNLSGISEEFRINLPADCGKILTVFAQQSGQELLPIIYTPELVSIADIALAPQSYSWFGGGAERIGFYQKNDHSWYAQAIGRSSDAIRYDVLYSIGDWATSAVPESDPLLREHHHLIEASAAFSLLDEASWFNDEEKDEAKRKSRLVTLMPQIQKYEKEFDTYIRSLRVAKTVTVSSGVDY